MISPIGFTGIRNIGYTKYYTNDEDDNFHSHHALNMKLTDDKNGKDLSAYKKLLRDNSGFKNEVGNEYLNIELDTFMINDLFAIKTKMNGNTVKRTYENRDIISFMDKLVHRIASFKNKDFDTDEWHHVSDEAADGLIYNESIDDYIDGTKGSLDLLCSEYNDDNLDGNAESLVLKLHRYLNDEVELSEEDDEKVIDAIEYILETLHNPMYVHNGAVIMNAMVEGMDKNKTDN